ncbi:hypothetical protein FB451DRAFT_1164922 [Mycena latifolia]|nr:hypothetical protein FB451DRAFT_1164922 [Mycena latifolia]
MSSHRHEKHETAETEFVFEKRAEELSTTAELEGGCESHLSDRPQPRKTRCQRLSAGSTEEFYSLWLGCKPYAIGNDISRSRASLDFGLPAFVTCEARNCDDGGNAPTSDSVGGRTSHQKRLRSLLMETSKGEGQICTPRGRNTLLPSSDAGLAGPSAERQDHLPWLQAPGSREMYMRVLRVGITLPDAHKERIIPGALLAGPVLRRLAVGGELEDNFRASQSMS